MRTLVLGADTQSTNLGVRVLAEGSAALVQRVFGDCEVVYLNSGVSTAPSPVGSWKTLVKERMRRDRRLKRWFSEFDLVIDTRSGDSFTDIYGMPRLVTQTLLVSYAHAARVPVVMSPQTVGPFGSRRSRMLARHSMARAAVVLARDHASFGVASALGERDVMLTTDVVFALAVPEVPRSRDVVVNPSGLLWGENPHVDAARYRRELTGLCHALLAQGRRITLLAHVLDSPQPDNDVPAVESLVQSLGESGVEVAVPDSLQGAREVVASAQLVVGSRMHACLNALSCGTPAIPWAYSVKFAPLFFDLGWHWGVDLRDAGSFAKQTMAVIDQPDLKTAAQVVSAAHRRLEVAVDAMAARVARP